MSDGTLPHMQEFVSLRVASAEHADLATQLTTMSTQGWVVVNIVSTGHDLIAYLARATSSTANSSTSNPSTASVMSGASNPSTETSIGWAAGASGSAAASTSTSPSIPADWYKDPSGRFEYRYWDGSKWTDNVSRAGVAYKDPPIP